MGRVVPCCLVPPAAGWPSSSLVKPSKARAPSGNSQARPPDMGSSGLPYGLQARCMPKRRAQPKQRRRAA